MFNQFFLYSYNYTATRGNITVSITSWEVVFLKLSIISNQSFTENKVYLLH